ncbi:MAG TPA: formylglycine-generating enzyme family protein [Gemmataceae bacterium]|nr:formylglycine-generating enzyme family protein [Gemmataceae bacterium]
MPGRWRGAIIVAGLTAAAIVLVNLQAAPVRVGTRDRHVNYTEKVAQLLGDKVTRVSFDMVAVPGGEFVMGSPKSEPDRKDDEGPQVKVRLKPFWIGKCEVTWDEFDLWYKTRYANKVDNPTLPHAPGQQHLNEPADAVTRPSQPYVDESYGFEKEQHPAICMTHNAAMTYCEWLSKKTGKQYRLPTEAEWEYACRAGTSTPYGIPAGDKLQDHAWFNANSATEDHKAGAHHPVGKKKPNAWGIHDMHGNVMEWCLDHYVADAYARFNRLLLTEGFVLSPAFRPTENKWSHVARGGHFKSLAKDLRSAARVVSDKSWMKADPQEPQSIWWLTNLPTVGFRVCRSLDDDEWKGLTGRVPPENNETYKP